MWNIITVVCFIICIASCTLLPKEKQKTTAPKADTVANTNNAYTDTSSPLYINTGNIKPEQLVSYAETLIGVPYVYASTTPVFVFDCSEFITYFLNHFNISVPRSSISFTNVPHKFAVTEEKPADLILFTGTDS